ncbi:MAG: hypothetical protein HY457_03650 [Parcubacteria group bacterium]|nr:hypothetical protein [Parcubacteria group bacterium]
MAINPTTLVVVAENALREVGLPPDPEGRAFIFGDGDHSVHFIRGTITAVGYGPEEGVTLRVSTPRFRGMDIRRLAFRDGSWVALGHKENEYRTGTFVLVPPKE